MTIRVEYTGFADSREISAASFTAAGFDGQPTTNWNRDNGFEVDLPDDVALWVIGLTGFAESTGLTPGQISRGLFTRNTVTSRFDPVVTRMNRKMARADSSTSASRTPFRVLHMGDSTGQLWWGGTMMDHAKYMVGDGGKFRNIGSTGGSGSWGATPGGTARETLGTSWSREYTTGQSTPVVTLDDDYEQVDFYVTTQDADAASFQIKIDGVTVETVSTLDTEADDLTSAVLIHTETNLTEGQTIQLTCTGAGSAILDGMDMIKDVDGLCHDWNISHSGFSSLGWSAALPSLTRYLEAVDFSLILYSAILNERARTLEAMIEDVTEIADVFDASAPNSVVVFVIPYEPSGAVSWGEKVSFIQQLCADRGYGLVDLYNGRFGPHDAADPVTSDGVHPNGGATKMLVEAITSQLFGVSAFARGLNTNQSVVVNHANGINIQGTKIAGLFGALVVGNSPDYSPIIAASSEEATGLEALALITRGEADTRYTLEP